MTVPGPRQPAFGESDTAWGSRGGQNSAGPPRGPHPRPTPDILRELGYPVVRCSSSSPPRARAAGPSGRDCRCDHRRGGRQDDCAADRNEAGRHGFPRFRQHPAHGPLVVEPASSAFVFTGFIVYSLVSALLLTPNVLGVAYEADGDLSPFFSPLHRVPGPPAWFFAGDPHPVAPRGLPGHLLLLPQGVLPGLLPRPAGLRRRGAVGSAGELQGGDALPFIFQNLHRYSCTWRSIPLSFLWLDVVHVAATGHGGFGVGVGAGPGRQRHVAALYTLSCHSFRHLVGGRLDCFSAPPAPGAATRSGSG